jgi:membrane fusion protein (multidrug efflux system)
MSDSLPASPPQKFPSLRNFSFTMKIGGIGFILLLIGILLYWLIEWRWLESTDNAYIKGEITPISSKVNGYVVELNVDDGDYIEKGQVLAVIDQKEYNAQYLKVKGDLESAEAELEQLPTRVEMEELTIEQIQLQMESARAEFERDDRAYNRAKNLYKSDVSSVKDYDTAKTNYIQSKVALEQLELSKKVFIQNIKVTKLDILKQKAKVESLKEQLKLMEISLKDTVILAPLSGVIGNRSIRKGQYVRTGSILLSIVPLDNIWIIANYKETQISNFVKGQSVEFTVDSFPGKKFQGKIISINPTSGAEFSLLPPENATGNFTKIVQRIPVKISIEDKKDYRLVPGMSVYMTVNTKKS